MSRANPNLEDALRAARPSLEDTIVYLRSTSHLATLMDWFMELREAQLVVMDDATTEREVWKAVGRMAQLDDIIVAMRGTNTRKS